MAVQQPTKEDARERLINSLHENVRNVVRAVEAARRDPRRIADAQAAVDKFLGDLMADEEVVG